jgi:hypothetical protein
VPVKSKVKTRTSASSSNIHHLQNSKDDRFILREFRRDDLVITNGTLDLCVIEDGRPGFGPKQKWIYCVRYLEGPNKGRSRIMYGSSLTLAHKKTASAQFTFEEAGEMFVAGAIVLSAFWAPWAYFLITGQPLRFN